MPAVCPDPDPGPNPGPITDPNPAPAIDLTLEASDFDIFPGFTGNLEPAGSVKVKFFDDDSMQFSYDMSGLNVDCIECGVSIHTGVTCASADQVLGHYYDITTLTADPWTVANGAAYSTDAHGDVKGFFRVTSGFNFAQNIGHAVVFYGQDGLPVSCGTLMTREMALQSENIDIFPGYTGSLEPVGSVKVNFQQDNTMLFSYDMAGLPRNCVECGVQIRTGVTCASADQVLGNYYSPTVESDPWVPELDVSYSSNEKGEGTGCFTLSTGFGFADTIGHAVVFTDQSNTPIGCGTLSTFNSTLEADNIDIFPGYNGSLAPAGSVKANFMEDDSFVLSYDVAGLPADCVECGISFQAGVSCADDGQIMIKEAESYDPSNSTAYSTNAKGNGKGFFHITSGFNKTANLYNAVIFHDQDGAQVGCGTLW